jgi:hypothetical protein
MRSLIALPALLGILSTIAAALPQGADQRTRQIGAPRYSGVATLREEVSIGSADGADEYLFGDISGIAVGRDGTIYAYDAQVPVIRAFDANGRFLRNIGRGGRGPGEYVAISGLAVLRDGRILQWDTGNWRMNVFAPTGASVASWPIQGSGMSSGSHGLLVDTAGTVYARRSVYGGIGTRFQTFWLRLNADGSIRDTVRLKEPAVEPPALEVRTENSSMSVGLPYAPAETRILSPMGYVLATNSARYEFAFEVGGSVRERFVRSVAPERVTSQERAQARHYVESRFRRSHPQWSWSGPDIPDMKPHFSDPVVALDGRIWLMHPRHLAERYSDTTVGGGGGGGIGGGRGASRGRISVSGPTKPQPPRRYDVYEPNGAFLGVVELPGGVSPQVSSGDLVWDSVTGEDDVVRVKRYRITWR